MIDIFTTPDGLTLSYERRGSGPLLVCHPGGPGGSAAEFRDFAGLDDTFELLLLSPRGSHGSDPADDYSLASYVADLEALREHLGVEQLDLLGFSHGGIVAMAYAAAHRAAHPPAPARRHARRLGRRGGGGDGARDRESAATSRGSRMRRRRSRRSRPASSPPWRS